MQNSVAKKIFAVGSAVVMTLSMVAPFAAHAAVHAAGTNVVTSDGTVWMITTTNTRRAYTSAGAFLSYGFNSWSQVMPASAEDLALPVDAAGFIPPQDGTIFCATATKGSDVSGECSLVTMGTKAAFTSAAVFTGLGFSFSRAQYGDSSFLSKTSNVDNTTAAHRAGVLVNNNGTVQLVGASGLLGIPDLATFNSWGYSFANVVPANAADKAMTQTGVMAARTAGQLSPSWTTTPTCTSNCTPVVSGNVSASLASDNPASGTAVAGQAIADLAHFTFSGTGTVTQVVLKRIGVSADATLSNVYLYNGNTKLTDAGSVSNGTVTFSNSNGIFTVNGSMTISVKSDIATGTSGQTVGVQLSSYTVANGTPMGTSISGNTFTIATATLATVTFSTPTATGSGSNVTAGTANVSLWSSQLTVGQRAVTLKYVSFRQVGSIQSNAIQNIKLYLNGVQVGSTASIDSNNNVAFDLSSNPATLNTGSQTLELRGDVVGGSSFNYSFRLLTVSDIVLVDTSYNVNISGTGTFPAWAGSVTTIQGGTISVQSDPAFNATQVVKNASNVTLGQWTMKAYGEDVKVQSLKVGLAFTGGATSTEGFNNLTLYVNGGAVGSSQNAVVGSGITASVGNTTNATSTFGTTNLFTIPAGTTVTVAVKGDMVNLASGSTWTSVTASLDTPASSLQGAVSFNSTPTSDIIYTGTALSIVSSSATVSKNTGYADQTVASNTAKQKIGSYVIQASNAEGVRVTGLTIGLSGTLSATTSLANLYIVTPSGQTNPVQSQSTTTFSTDFTIPANSTANVDVYADISNTAGTIISSLSGTGIGSSSGQTVYMNTTGTSGGLGVVGQTINVGSGVIYPTNVSLQSSSRSSSFVIGGSTGQAIATYNVVATSSSVTITDLVFYATSTTSTAVPITSVTVGGITSPVAGATSTISGLNLVVPAGFGGLDIPVTVNYAPVGLSGNASNQTAILKLNDVKYTSGSTTAHIFPGTSSNTMVVVGSYPSVTLTDVSGSLSAGTQIIGKVVVTANAAGNVILTALPISVSTANASISGTLNLIDESNNQVATTTTMTVASGANATTTLMVTANNNITAGSTKTYDVQVTVAGVGSSGTTPSISLSLGSAFYLTFTDVNGNATGITGALTLGGATLIPNYTITSVSLP